VQYERVVSPRKTGKQNIATARRKMNNARKKIKHESALVG
jgi:hypothetical protein